MALLVIDIRACSEHPARIEQVAFAVVGAMSAEMARHGLGGDAAEAAEPGFQSAVITVDALHVCNGPVVLAARPPAVHVAPWNERQRGFPKGRPFGGGKMGPRTSVPAQHRIRRLASAECDGASGRGCCGCLGGGGAPGDGSREAAVPEYGEREHERQRPQAGADQRQH